MASAPHDAGKTPYIPPPTPKTDEAAKTPTKATTPGSMAPISTSAGDTKGRTVKEGSKSPVTSSSVPSSSPTSTGNVSHTAKPTLKASIQARAAGDIDPGIGKVAKQAMQSTARVAGGQPSETPAAKAREAALNELAALLKQPVAEIEKKIHDQPGGHLSKTLNLGIQKHLKQMELNTLRASMSAPPTHKPAPASAQKEESALSELTPTPPRKTENTSTYGVDYSQQLDVLTTSEERAVKVLYREAHPHAKEPTHKKLLEFRENLHSESDVGRINDLSREYDRALRENSSRFDPTLKSPEEILELCIYLEAHPEEKARYPKIPGRPGWQK